MSDTVLKVANVSKRFGGLQAVQVVGIVLCIVIPLIGWALLARQVGRFVSLYRMGQPDAGRTGAPLTRSWVLTKEFLGHTRMSRLKVVAAAHWFTALSFIILFATLVNAFLQLVQPDYRLPLIGFFPPFEWLIEVFAWGGFIGIVVLVAIRQKNHPRSAAGEGCAAVGGLPGRNREQIWITFRRGLNLALVIADSNSAGNHLLNGEKSLKCEGTKVLCC
jgi:hypothetical protein